MKPIHHNDAHHRSARVITGLERGLDRAAELRHDGLDEVGDEVFDRDALGLRVELPRRRDETKPTHTPPNVWVASRPAAAPAEI